GRLWRRAALRRHRPDPVDRDHRAPGRAPPPEAVGGAQGGRGLTSRVASTLSLVTSMQLLQGGTDALPHAPVLAGLDPRRRRSGLRAARGRRRSSRQGAGRSRRSPARPARDGLRAARLAGPARHPDRLDGGLLGHRHAHRGAARQPGGRAGVRGESARGRHSLPSGGPPGRHARRLPLGGAAQAGAARARGRGAGRVVTPPAAASPLVGGSDRGGALDWPRIARDLDADGCAVVGALVSSDECAELAALYADDARFRSRVVMARHGFGRGEYKYFGYPLPGVIDDLRTTLYPRLASIANDWNAAMGIAVRYPDTLGAFLDRCHRAGQSRPTP